MALTFSIVRYFPPLKGGLRQRIVDITADTDYPTGGWAITAANFKLNGVLQVHTESVGGYVLEHDNVNAKLKAYWGDNNNTSDGPLIEIPAGDNGIDTKVFRCHVTGY